MFWDAVGSHLDFTNPATAAWWRAQVHEKLLDLGIGSTWNDNNEWRVEDESAVCHGFGTPTPLRLVRPVQALLMVRASLEAQRAHAPTLRPWLISRSGMPGTQRYAQTWSGDNYTSWHTLKHNVRMGLGLSLSGFFNTGHDVGGFAGPAPEPELFVRWVQNGVFHPRFTIHSWNTHLDGTPDGTCNEHPFCQRPQQAQDLQQLDKSISLTGTVSIAQNDDRQFSKSCWSRSAPSSSASLASSGSSPIFASYFLPQVSCGSILY